MKKLFALLISFSFVVTPMNFVHAESSKEYEFEDTKSKQLTGIAIAATGVSLLIGCGMASRLPSTTAYAAGAMAYIAFEMAGAKKQKEDHEQKLKETLALADKKQMGGEVQRETIVRLIEEEEEMKSYSDKRKSQLNIVGLAFKAASALAVLEAMELAAWLIAPIKWPLIPPFKSPFCTPATATPSEGVALGVASSFGVAAGAGMAAGGLTGGIAGVGVLALASGATTPLLNAPSARVAAFLFSSVLVTRLAGDMGKRAEVSEKRISKLKEMLAKFDAEANVTTTVAVDTTAGATSGAASGATSGSTAGVTSGVTSGGLTGGLTGGGLPGGSLGGGNGVRGGSPYDLATLSTRKINPRRVCLSQKSAGLEMSTNCSNPIRLAAPKLSIRGNDSDLNNALNSSVDFANAVASGNSEAANIAGASLSANAAKIDAAAAKAKKRMNDDQLAQGKKKIDFDKDMKDQISSLQSAIDKELAKNNQSMAGLGAYDLNKLDPNAAASGLNINAVASDGVAIPSSTGDANTATEQGPAITDGTIADTSTTSEEKKPGDSATDALGKNLNEFETSDDDISKNKEGSLWKQVTNRYFMKYDRFFERKKLPSQ